MVRHVNLTAALYEVFLPRKGEFKRSFAFAYCRKSVFGRCGMVL